MNHDTQAIIALLESRLSRIPLNGTREQRELRDAIEAEIAEQKSKPVSGPVTLERGGIRRSEGPFSSLGQQLQAVMRAGMPNGPVDQRLHDVTAEASGLNETVPSDGGFLVQQDFSNDLLARAIQTGKLAKLAWQIPISANSNSVKMNGVDETSRASHRSGGILSYWASEAEEKTKSKPKFRQVELTLRKLIGLCYATDEMLQDASVLNVTIPKLFGDEFGFRLDDAILNGNGAGQPLGIMNAGCLVTVSKETGQAAATILTENVTKMFSRLYPGSEDRAYWLANKSVLPQLMQLSLTVGIGGSVPLWMPANQLAGRPVQTLMGLPLIYCEQCEVLGTTGDLILADLSDGYLLAQKGGIQQDVSIHVRFIYDESVFRFVLRVDGQPVRATALTPYKGGAGNTMSHFVALQTRS